MVSWFATVPELDRTNCVKLTCSLRKAQWRKIYVGNKENDILFAPSSDNKLSTTSSYTYREKDASAQGGEEE